MIAFVYEVVSRATPRGAKRDSAIAGTALGAVAAARCLLAEARDEGCREPVCDFLVYGHVVLHSVRYRDLTPKALTTKERE